MQNSSKFETRGMQSQTRSSRRQLHRRAYPGPADHHEVAVPSKARKGGLLGAAATYYVPRKRLREFLLEAGRVQKAERHVTPHVAQHGGHLCLSNTCHALKRRCVRISPVVGNGVGAWSLAESVAANLVVVIPGLARREHVVVQCCCCCCCFVRHKLALAKSIRSET